LQEVTRYKERQRVKFLWYNAAINNVLIKNISPLLNVNVRYINNVKCIHSLFRENSTLAVSELRNLNNKFRKK